MELSRQNVVVTQFRSWFEGGNAAQGQGISVKRTLEDNRRRYRMILADAQKRTDLGLSALASTKSTSIVDNAVVDAIQEYYQTDAITFSANDDGGIDKDLLAKWMTQLFQIRAKKNGFWIWHLQSLKAGFVDGMEAAMVRWRKETYDYSEKVFTYLPTGEVITEKEYNEAKKLGDMVMEGQFDPSTGAPVPVTIPFDELYSMEKVKKTRTVADTWECVQLKPGESLLWDFKNPLMDLDRGQWAVAILNMSVGDIRSLCKAGVFKNISEEDLKKHATSSSQSANQNNYTDYTSLATDPNTVDMGELNTIEVWVSFEKKNCQWMVSFSIKGEKELTDEESVNDVFFGGRFYDGLPIVMGVSDFELYEALGRGIPKLIAPIEDELSDHRNNVNDMAKQAATGKYRVNPDSDTDLNSLLNDKIFYARQGEVDKLDFSQEMNVVMRAADMTGSDIAALAPVSMADSHIVGKGNAGDTLGSVQLALGGNDKKLNARLLIRNYTFLSKILRIVAEMTMAFETDQTIARVALKKGNIDPAQFEDVVDGQPVINFGNLDFDVDIQINAGLGNVPKQQRAAKIMQYTEWAKAHGVAVDIPGIDKQLKVLNGFNEDQFVLPEGVQKPQPPPVEYKATVNIDLATLLQFSPEAGQFLLEKMMNGEMGVTASIKERSDKIPGYLKEEQDGSPSHMLEAQHKTTDLPQGIIGGA